MQQPVWQLHRQYRFPTGLHIPGFIKGDFGIDRGEGATSEMYALGKWVCEDVYKRVKGGKRV